MYAATPRNLKQRKSFPEFGNKYDHKSEVNVTAALNRKFIDSHSLSTGKKFNVQSIKTAQTFKTKLILQIFMQ